VGQSLQQEMALRIQSGLSRKSITEPSRWACKYRFMGHPYPGKWTFDHHPWLREMHDSKAEFDVGQKSAQVGFTEWALNVCCHFLDIKRMDALYVLPTTDDASTFSAGRFDKALELSAHMQSMFSDVKNVRHKRAGPTNMYIRGSNSESGLKSVPVSLLILDELDEMNQENIPLALKRLSGQIERKCLMISTPTIPDFGINYHYEDSTKEHFFFPCPSCGRQIELKWPESMVVCGEKPTDPDVEKSHLICYECKATLPHEAKHEFLAKGKYVAEHPDRKVRGFYINQMYAMHLRPSVQATNFLKGKRDVAAEQEFMNSDIGVPHIVKGAKITDEMINLCIKNYRKLDFNRKGIITMGVDVGTLLHVEIDAWQVDARSGYDVNSYSRAQMLTHLEVENFEDLDRLMFDFSVHFCVIDSQPDRRKSLEFANRFPGRVRLCRYPNGVNGRSLTVSPEEEFFISVDRTSWLDMSLGRFKNGTIDLPMDVSQDYKNHITAQVRKPEVDNYGNTFARYITPGNRHDHYGHARNYAEIALPFALNQGVNTDIRG
jgi:hypothetical protein